MTAAQNWTRAERLVAAEIAAAVKAGRGISGDKIIAITGLSQQDVCDALRKLGRDGLIRPATGEEVG